MAINGQRFLTVSKACDFVITRHSLVRIQEFTGCELTMDEAFSSFCQSEQLTFSDMLARGYRPGYKRRIQKGIHSWYFLLRCQDHELIAVITDGECEGDFEWVTTFAPNHRNESNRRWMEEPYMKAA